MLNNLITSSKLNKLLVSQSYFVWNNLSDQDNMADDENVQFDFPSFVDNPTDLEEYGISFSQIQVVSFGIVANEYQKWLNNKFSNIYKLKSKTLEERAAETLDVIKNKKAKHIFNPTFLYKYKEHEVLAVPALYDIENKIVYFNKNSGSTKRKDIIKMYFDSMVIEELGFQINNVKLHIFATKEYKKNEIDFHETAYINTTNASRSSKPARDAFDYSTMQQFKAGEGVNEKTNTVHENSTIWDIIASKELATKKSTRNKEGESYFFKDLNEYLDEIIAAKQVKTFEKPNVKDNTAFGFNPQWEELVKEKSPEYYGFNGKFVTKQNVIEEESFDNIAVGSPVVAQNIELTQPKINDEFFVDEMLARLANQIVWYDFEAFSLPISPLKGVLPFNQVVSQVSVITTENNVELDKANLVLDPKTYNLDYFIQLIDVVYRPGFEYVVYNKGYENARWLEMGKLLTRYNHKKASYFNKRVQDIIDHTIDLADLFKVSSKKTLPIIAIPELKLKHSIKLLENYVTNHCPYLPYKIKEYKSLAIKQGMMAMETANYRALNLIGDNEWNTKIAELKEYCENDVRAMIMVYYLVQDIHSKNK